MKKLLSIAMVLVLLAVSAAGCGTPAKNAEPVSEAPAADATPVPESAPESAPEVATAPDAAPEATADTNTGSGEQVKLKFYAVLPEEHPVIASYIKLFEEIKTRSNGNIVIEMNAGGILGTEQEGFDMIRNGDIDGGMMNVSYYEAFVPETQGWLMPYTFTDYAESMKYFNEYAVDNIFNTTIREKTGMLALSTTSPGFRNLTLNAPAKKPADLAGKRVRTMESPMSISYVAGLGASAVPLAWAEVYMGLSTGTLDGQENPVGHIQTYSLYEVQKYLITTKHALTVSFSVFNEAKWNALNEADRALIQKAFKDWWSVTVQDVLNYENDTYSKLEKEFGMTVLRDEDIEKQAFVDSVDAYIEANFGGAEYEGLRQYREAARKWIEENR